MSTLTATPDIKVQGTPGRDRTLEIELVFTGFEFEDYESTVRTYSTGVETFTKMLAPLAWKTLKDGTPNKPMTAWIEDMKAASDIWFTTEDETPTDHIRRDDYAWLTGIKVRSIRWV